MKSPASIAKLTAGIGQVVNDVFGSPKKTPSTVGEPPHKASLLPGYPTGASKEERIRFLAWRFYREGSFEKTQFTRKWMRNALIFQGYHDLEENNVGGWDAVLRETQDYAFPDNYYRTHILNGSSLYVKNAPQFVFGPGAEDFESEGIAMAADASFEVIKENVGYDALRVWEAIYLRLFGNSFRYSYYSLDPRYGHITAPVYQNETVQIDPGSYACPTCGSSGPGNPPTCPECGSELPPDAMQPPTMGEVPRQTGTVDYPRGQEQSEIVSPFEVGMRSSAMHIRNTPYLYRARIVDKLALQGDFEDIDLGGEGGGDGAGESSSQAAGDMALSHQQTLADLPGDPTQGGAWYERSTEFSKTMFLQVWIRPAQYRHDKELAKEFPDGLYAGCAGNKLLESKNESLDDHWVHFIYNPAPHRIWGDGDDDLIPKQLQLNETERLIVRNQAYNSVPQTAIDSQRVDKDKFVNDPAELIVVKTNGRAVAEAFHQLEAKSLPQETWQWRASILTDMEYHARVSPSAIGMHQPGVNTFGGQQDMADRAEMTYSPLLLLYKEANEQWARQVLKLAAENWLDDRVHSVMGINGHWEFRKLRGAMLDLDRVKIVAKIIPVDYSLLQAMTQAIAAGALDATDPRVQRKMLELSQLPTELNTFSADSKVQWKEIEKMKQGQAVEPVLLRDNDAVHIEICRSYLNSDASEEDPQEVTAQVLMHMQKHMMNQLKLNQVNAVVQAGAQEAAGSVGGTVEQPGQEQQQEPAQGGQRGGQVPKSAAVRKGRSQKANASAANTPQPPEGNQTGRSSMRSRRG